ncbi:MAG: hypothetical protein EOO77_24170 [Oxalobacteraceae bacterium]|nr:MAG: hypothetical protein EOO77_24170 [Oxalobacteraceae bacterium]
MLADKENMKTIEVDAYDCRHPEHVAMMAMVDDKGLDIELLPTFTVEIDVSDTDEASPSRGWP